MLTAYIDESGHESRGWMSLAGYFGNEEQWKAFVPKWRAALGPQRKFLHMTELRWNMERTRRLLERLGPIPEACGLKGVMGGVRYQDYEDLVTGTPEEKLLKGYIACLVPMVIQILRGIPKDERLELYLEQQHEYEPFANMALQFAVIPEHPWTTTSDGRPKLAKWGFVPKRSTSMTDPADYLAFALRETWTDRKSKKARWCSPILTSGSGEGYGLIMDRELIRRTVRNSQIMTIYQSIQQQLQGLFRGEYDEVRIKVPKSEREFLKFDSAIRKLVTIPHSDLKSKLDAEKKAKKRKKSRKSSASREANAKD